MKTSLVAGVAGLLLSVGAGQASAQDDMTAMPPTAPSMETGMATSTGRPVPRSVAIGIGSTVGNDLTIPNIGSARFVLTPTFILEPQVTLAFSKQEVEPAGGVTTSTSTTTLGVGAVGRILLASRGPVDLNLLAGASLQHTGNDQVVDSSSQTAAIAWGLGLSWFFNQWWSLSLDAMNPFLGLTRMSQDTALGLENVQSNWTLGLVFDPSITVSIHAYL